MTTGGRPLPSTARRPTGCPSVSLTVLNRSRSRMNSVNWLPWRRDARERLLHFLQQHGAIGEARQVVMAGHVSDLRFGPLLRGDVLMNRDPAAVRHRPVIDGDGTPVAHEISVQYGSPLRTSAKRFSTKALVSVGLLPCRPQGFQNGTQRHAGFCLIAREAVDLAIAFVANDQSARCGRTCTGHAACS